MGPAEGHSEANSSVSTGTSIPYLALLIRFGSEFLPVYNGGVLPCKSLVHQLKIIRWDINEMWL